MTGPRDYSTGTERALVALSQGTCYFPDCPVPTIVFVEGEPVTNVEFAHICGAKPGAPRFDPTMSDQERRSYDNLVLLCKPHHVLVDRIHPDRFPTHVVKKWKTDREGPGIAALRGLQGLTEGRLEEMLEAAIRTAGPQRAVILEVAGGVLLDDHSAVTIPLDGWRTILGMNPSMTGRRIVVATARNTGALQASIDSISIWLRLGPDGPQLETSLLGRNDFPLLNPSLPTHLDVGESIKWLTSLETFEWVISKVALSGVGVAEFWAELALGSGEKITSASHSITLLPLGQTLPTPVRVSSRGQSPDRPGQ